MKGPGGAPLQWELALPFLVPLSMNDSQPMAVWARIERTKKVKLWRDTTHVLAQHAGIPRLERFTAVLHWIPPTNRRRDVENYFATVKPLVDGLIDAGVAPDDTPQYYVSSTPVIHNTVKGQPSRLWLIVIDLSDEQTVLDTNQGDQNG